MASPVEAAEPASTSAACHLLSLPKELRCHIWAYTMVPNSTEHLERQLDLLTTSPPGLSLLLTCHLIHAEAYDDFVEGCRDFWATRHFVIYGHKGMSMDFVRSLSERRLELITKLTLIGEIADLNYGNGIWSSTNYGKKTSEYFSAWGFIIMPSRALKVANTKTTGWQHIHSSLGDNDTLWPLRWDDQECVFRELPYGLDDESLVKVKRLGNWDPLTRLEVGAMLQRFMRVENER